MDLNGVYASLNFPSFLPGFAGQRLQQLTDDPELALACVRAWNDWHLEEWAGHSPGRIIPLQIPYVLDPEVGAEEIRRNAAPRVQGGDVQRGTRTTSASRACTPTTGTR